MSKICNCPVPTYIADIVTSDTYCSDYVGQVQKMLFWRSGNSIASVATAIIEATWTTLLSATDATKAVVSPFVSAPTFEPSEPREYGGGNETRDGIPILLGRGHTMFSANIINYPQATIKLFKELECEDLEVIFVNEQNKLVHRLDGTTVKGFPIKQFFVGDKSFGGYETADINLLRFYLKPNWSDDLTITDPTENFNPLELTN